jgi:hypothetical protein
MAAKAREASAKTGAEGRASVHQREMELAENEFKLNEERIQRETEQAEEDAKEAERRAGLSPEEQAAEISPFAATVPHFSQMFEPHHSAEFILTEANGQRSRGAGYFADPTTVYVGMPVKLTAPGTSNQPPTYVPATAGADCMALCIYAGGSIPGEGLRVALIVRDAEVNKNLISWGSITAPEQAIGITTLAAQGIIAR